MRRKQEHLGLGMSDISGVNAVWQHAIAKSSVQITTELYESLQTGPLREQSVFENARFAATMAAKNTSSILPYSYPKELTCVLITFDWKISASVWELLIQVEVKAKHATPVDTEAMTSASIAALSIYDSCNKLSKSIVLGPTYLSRKGT
ncbi:cyclic pyranopterin phosphate synthase [Alkalihalobacillus xiaoxiensis]|uniref:Cyclic pyranopterin phosphate synthase n=1 Tax=Shouchella xiaoxiensis TaxID=766895 RepID=A0ABS2SSS6_9BACI|nr:cyclic pyranopterin monophosphate synthase MoaC [Shouchella xiaoxiensis]MBM7838583.1 cyclic pyranopterin phosphate synthase [Shouchella xiaoxiensis]